MTVRHTHVTANIGRGVPPAETRDNFQRVRHGFPGAVIGWQEIDEADAGNEHAMLAATFGPDHYRNVGFAHACPISVPSAWTVIEAKVTLACHWLRKATPDRWIVEAICEHPRLSAPVRFANGHQPLARLGGKEGQQRWDDSEQAWEARADEWHRSKITTIATRDSNRLHNMPPLHARAYDLLPNAISRISVVPGSVAVTVLGRRDVNLTVDGHDARGVELSLSDKK